MANLSAGRFRTPLSRARGMGASRHGVSHFITERVSGLALIPLTLWAVFAGLRLSGPAYRSQEAVASWIAAPHNTVLLALLLVVALVHLKGAIQVVIEDYIERFTTKTVLVVANLFVCVVAGAAGIVSILKVALTGAL